MGGSGLGDGGQGGYGGQCRDGRGGGEDETTQHDLTNARGPERLRATDAFPARLRGSALRLTGSSGLCSVTRLPSTVGADW